MEDELDLSKAKITKDNEIYVSVILDSIKENYGIKDPESRIKSMGYSLEDLISPKKVEEILDLLNSENEGN
jgi:hypothetical protein